MPIWLQRSLLQTGRTSYLRYVSVWPSIYVSIYLSIYLSCGHSDRLYWHCKVVYQTTKIFINFFIPWIKPLILTRIIPFLNFSPCFLFLPSSSRSPLLLSLISVSSHYFSSLVLFSTSSRHFLLLLLLLLHLLSLPYLLHSSTSFVSSSSSSSSSSSGV